MEYPVHNIIGMGKELIGNIIVICIVIVILCLFNSHYPDPEIIETYSYPDPRVISNRRRLNRFRAKYADREPCGSCKMPYVNNAKNLPVFMINH